MQSSGPVVPAAITEVSLSSSGRDAIASAHVNVRREHQSLNFLHLSLTQVGPVNFIGSAYATTNLQLTLETDTVGVFVAPRRRPPHIDTCHLKVG
jgi:hypothetical protein